MDIPIGEAMLGLSTGAHRRRGAARKGGGARRAGLPAVAHERGAASTPAGVRADDQAPDGKVGGVRLFCRVPGTENWTLLGATAPVVGVRGTPCSSEYYGPGLFLGRPDGDAGWAGDSADGLNTFLDRIRTPLPLSPDAPASDSFTAYPVE